MGITGLEQFIKSCTLLKLEENWIGREKQDRFFIDGNAFVHQYRKDWLYGGDYKSMAQNVRETVRQLKSVGIEPVFVFDGTVPADKLNTRTGRQRQAIKNCTLVMNDLERVSGNLVYMQSSLFLISPWTLDVVIQTLRELQVRVQVCEQEADEELVRLAELEQGYVVSRDSDMYVYPRIGKGYISLESLSISSSVSALVYRPDRLARLLKLDITLLPLLGVLMGNDYVHKWGSVVEAWSVRRGFKAASWPVVVAEFINQHGGLIQNIQDLAPEDNREELSLVSALAKYHIDYVPTQPSTEIQSRLLMEIIRNQNFWSSIFLEDIGKESSWTISQSLREAIYEVQRERLGLDCYEVTEYVREKQHLASVQVFSQKRTQENDWCWFTELHYSKEICLEPYRNSSGLCCLILCVRYLIHQRSLNDRLENHEVIAIVLCTLRSLSSCLGFASVPVLNVMPALNKRYIHLSAQYQSVVHSSHLLSQMLNINLQLPLAYLYDGTLFHYYLKMTRNGESLGELMAGYCIEFSSLFFKIYKLVTLNMEKEIKMVYEYNLEKVSFVRPKKNILKNKTYPIAKKLKSTISNNPFDLLDS